PAERSRPGRAPATTRGGDSATPIPMPAGSLTRPGAGGPGSGAGAVPPLRRCPRSAEGRGWSVRRGPREAQPATLLLPALSASAPLPAAVGRAVAQSIPRACSHDPAAREEGTGGLGQTFRQSILPDRA